jgi:hypothetical protein
VIRFLEALDTATDASWFMRWMLGALMLKVAEMDHSVIWTVFGLIIFVSAFAGGLRAVLRNLGVRL